MNKILFSLVVLILYPFVSNAQFEVIETKAPDLLKKNAVVFFVNSGECANCYMFLNDALRRVKESPYKDNVIFVTNNAVFTKQLLKEMDYEDVSKVYFDKKAFQNEKINGYNTICIKNKSQTLYMNKATYDSKLFSQLLTATDAELLLLGSQIKTQNVAPPFSKNHSFRDSLLASDYFSSGVCDYGVLLLDKAMQNLYFFQEEEKLKVKLNKFSFLDSSLYQSLPQRVDTSKFQLMSYEASLEIFAKEKIPILNVSVIKMYNNTLYCFYTINKMYNRKGTDNIDVFPSCFISTLKINSKESFGQISDISKFDHLYYVDIIKDKGKKYPIGVWINDHAIIEDDNILNINLNLLSDDETDIQFAGKAKIQLMPESSSIQILSIDATAPKLIKVENELSHNKQKYKIKKTITDEENNIGDIEILLID